VCVGVASTAAARSGAGVCMDADSGDVGGGLVAWGHVGVEEVASARVVVGKPGGGAGDREIDVGVAGYEEIGTAVAVDVCDRRTRMPAVASDPGSPRALGKRAVAVVPQQLVLSVGRDEEVGVAVPVEVRGDTALAADCEPCSRGAGHVPEAASRVTEKRAPRQAAVLVPAIDVGLRARVYDEQIDPPVAVVVERTQPAAGHRRRVGRDTEAKRTLTEVEPDPTGDVLQANP